MSKAPNASQLCAKKGCGLHGLGINAESLISQETLVGRLTDAEAGVPAESSILGHVDSPADYRHLLLLAAIEICDNARPPRAKREAFTSGQDSSNGAPGGMRNQQYVFA
jgi:hypothetical protein